MFEEPYRGGGDVKGTETEKRRSAMGGVGAYLGSGWGEKGEESECSGHDFDWRGDVGELEQWQWKCDAIARGERCHQVGTATAEEDDATTIEGGNLNLQF